jgi:hypothetical protein
VIIHCHDPEGKLLIPDVDTARKLATTLRDGLVGRGLLKME